jgi:glycosyltransferase involved in cell wall biosynthesis
VNVLYLTDNPNLGGTVRILQSWLPLARERGVVPLVAVRPGSAFAGWLRDHGVEHVSNPMPWPDRRAPWVSLWHAGRLALWARARGVGILHCNEHNIYPFATLLRRLLRVPLVCHVRYRVTREFSTWAFGPASRQPDALLWTSRQQRLDSAAAIEGVVPDQRQRILPLGIDLERFGRRRECRADTRTAWGADAAAIVIGQATALRPRKRIEDFVDLVARLVREDARVIGALAGDAPPGDEDYREAVRRRIHDTGLGPRFHWAGNLDDVEPFYQGLDVFVSTSEYETFGNSVCEAMACGVPVAAYRGGSVGEVVGDTGLIVETGDCEALFQAVRTLVTDPARRRELGERGRSRVASEFNPARSLSDLIDIYRALLAGGALPSGADA